MSCQGAPRANKAARPSPPTRTRQDYVIDGVKFSLVDRLGALSASGGGGGVLLSSSRGADGGPAEDEGGYEVENDLGVRLMVMDAPAWEMSGGGGGDEEGDVVDVEAMPLDG